MMSPVANHVTLVPAPSSARASFPNQNDRERSRNAKAQARHRAKRKAYVEQVMHSPIVACIILTPVFVDVAGSNRHEAAIRPRAEFRRYVIDPVTAAPDPRTRRGKLEAAPGGR